MLYSLKQTAKRTARKSALTAGAVIAFLVSVGFLTSAIWTTFAAAYDPVTASLIVGGGYFGIGLILVAVAMSTGSETTGATSDPEPLRAARNPEQPNSNLPPLAQAFMYGLNAGFNSERR